MNSIKKIFPVFFLLIVLLVNVLYHIDKNEISLVYFTNNIEKNLIKDELDEKEENYNIKIHSFSIKKDEDILPLFNKDNKYKGQDFMVLVKKNGSISDPIYDLDEQKINMLIEEISFQNNFKKTILFKNY